MPSVLMACVDATDRHLDDKDEILGCSVDLDDETHLNQLKICGVLSLTKMTILYNNVQHIKDHYI